jgi:hypothetical protein
LSPQDGYIRLAAHFYAEVGQARLPMPSTSCRTRSPGLATLARGWWNDPLRVSFHHFRDHKVVVVA